MLHKNHLHILSVEPPTLVKEYTDVVIHNLFIFKHFVPLLNLKGTIPYNVGLKVRILLITFSGFLYTYPYYTKSMKDRTVLV